MSEYKEIENSANELRKVLDEISNEFFNDDFENATKILEDFYERHKRHLYSAISQYIIDYKDDEERIAYLAYGISEIIDSLDDKSCNSELKKQLLKLYDHIQLEYIRLTSVTQKLEAQIHESKNASVELESKINALSEKAEELEKKLGGMEREYIAILGIFAAIVIAFVGEMTFSTSVLENVHNLGDIFTIIVVIAMVGLSFANILFSLFYFVGKIVKDDGIVNNGIWRRMNIVVGGIIFVSIIAHFLLEHNAIRRIILFFKDLV